MAVEFFYAKPGKLESGKLDVRDVFLDSSRADLAIRQIVDQPQSPRRTRRQLIKTAIEQRETAGGFA